MRPGGQHPCQKRPYPAGLRTPSPGHCASAQIGGGDSPGTEQDWSRVMLSWHLGAPPLHPPLTSPPSREPSGWAVTQAEPASPSPLGLTPLWGRAASSAPCAFRGVLWLWVWLWPCGWLQSRSRSCLGLWILGLGLVLAVAPARSQSVFWVGGLGPSSGEAIHSRFWLPGLLLGRVLPHP